MRNKEYRVSTSTVDTPTECIQLHILGNVLISSQIANTDNDEVNNSGARRHHSSESSEMMISGSWRPSFGYAGKSSRYAASSASGVNLPNSVTGTRGTPACLLETNLCVSKHDPVTHILNSYRASLRRPLRMYSNKSAPWAMSCCQKSLSELRCD
jgi:hypothetical protein